MAIQLAPPATHLPVHGRLDGRPLRPRHQPIRRDQARNVQQHHRADKHPGLHRFCVLLATARRYPIRSRLPGLRARMRRDPDLCRQVSRATDSQQFGNHADGDGAMNKLAVAVASAVAVTGLAGVAALPGSAPPLAVPSWAVRASTRGSKGSVESHSSATNNDVSFTTLRYHF